MDTNKWRTFFQLANIWPMNDNVDLHYESSLDKVVAMSIGPVTVHIYGKLVFHIEQCSDLFLAGS